MLKMKKEKTRLDKMSAEKLMKLASYLSVGTALFLIVLKVISFMLTNSLALLSSLMDSSLDLGASAVSLIAIHQALQPPDKDHRFGHGKAEALGGMAQGFIIIVSALFLLVESIDAFFNPRPLRRFDIGVVVMLLAIVATLFLILFQRFVIRKTNSIAISADSAHYVGDIGMNVGVIISMFFSYTLQFHFIDTAFALLVSLYLFLCAIRVFRQVMAVLMDKELDKSVRKQIKELILTHPDVKSASDLRTRGAGLHSFVQFTVRVDKKTTLERAHEICDELEQKIKHLLPHTEIFVHIEPQED